jgi:hypothetical protein
MSVQENPELHAQLERLPEQIRTYYDTYFTELRKGLASPDLFSEAVPDFLRGRKKVLTISGTDGVVVAHFPAELGLTWSDRGSGEVLLRFPIERNAEADRYEFVAYPYAPSSEIVEEIVSGGEDVEAGISPGVPWGVGGFNEPQRKVDPQTEQVTWQAPWTRLVYADYNNLSYFQDTERAKSEARKDLEPYLRGMDHKELDEVRAPGNIEGTGIKAGDRGIVLEVFEHPRPALLVEYADLEGQTKALVTYSIDLEEVLDVFVDRDFLENREPVSDQDGTVRDGTLDFQADERMIPGQLVHA